MKKLFFIVIIIAVACLGLVACVKPDQPGPGQPIIDDFGTPGFKRDVTTSSEMFDDFVGGLMQTMKYASSEVVPSQFEKIAISLRLELDFNGNQSYILFKSGYDAVRPQNTTVCIEVYSKATEELQAGMYLFEKTSHLYLQLYDNKIKIPIEPGSVSGIFPINMRFDADASMLVASGLKSFMFAKGDIDYEYKIYKPDKNNSYCERHFRFDVDVARSLKQLAQMNADWQSTLGLKNGEMDFIFENILGVGSADILAGNIPDSKVTVEFSTQGGNPDFVGYGRLTKLKINMDVDKTVCEDGVFGKDINLLLNATQVNVSNSTAQGLPNENAFSDFVDYNETKFRLHSEMKYDEESENNDVVIDFIYDADDGEKTSFLLSAIGKDTGAENCSIYYLNRYIYLNWISGGQEYNIEGHFDFNRFMQELGGIREEEAKSGLFSILSYLLSSLRLQNGIISYRFEPRFFGQLSGVDIETLLEIFDRCSDEDVAALLEAEGAAITDLYRPFTLLLHSSETIIEPISEILLPENLDQLNSETQKNKK